MELLIAYHPPLHNNSSSGLRRRQDYENSLTRSLAMLDVKKTRFLFTLITLDVSVSLFASNQKSLYKKHANEFNCLN